MNATSMPATPSILAIMEWLPATVLPDATGRAVRKGAKARYLGWSARAQGDEGVDRAMHQESKA
jgi:hypothetical protein